MKKTEDSLRELWDNIKLQGSQKKEYEKFFEEIIVEKFPNMEKKVAKQVQEAQRVPHRINPRKNTPRHILIKLTKTKHKERLLKAAREKQQVTHKETQLNSRSSPGQKGMARYI